MSIKINVHYIAILVDIRTLAHTMSTHSHNHSHNIDFKTAFTITKEPNSHVKITGEIPYEELAHERAGAIKSLGKNVELDGFRKGHVPESILVQRFGEMVILTEMAERAISHFYPHILEEHAIEAIGYPKIEITKIAPNNPLGFTALVAVIPEVILPDYKEIANIVNKSKNTTDISEEELESKIKEILRQKIAYERLQKKAQPSETTDLPTPDTVTPEAEIEVPDLTDEFVKTLGQPGQFNDVADFKTKLRAHLEIEKKQEVNSEHRAKITDAIIVATTIELPQILIDSELNQMFGQMEEDLKRSGLKMEDYLAHIKKTQDDMKAEWTPAAEKRAKLQLILNEIAKKENIKADEKLTEERVNELLAHYKDANADRVRTYVETILVNEIVLNKLEGENK